MSPASRKTRAQTRSVSRSRMAPASRSLAHAAAAKTYREKYRDAQAGSVTMVVNSDWREPARVDDPADVAGGQLPTVRPVPDAEHRGVVRVELRLETSARHVVHEHADVHRGDRQAGSVRREAE